MRSQFKVMAVDSAIRKIIYEPFCFHLKLLEENLGGKLSDIALGNIFFSDISPRAKETLKNEN